MQTKCCRMAHVSAHITEETEDMHACMHAYMHTCIHAYMYYHTQSRQQERSRKRDLYFYVHKLQTLVRGYIAGEDLCLCPVLRVRSPFVESTDQSDHPFGSIENPSLFFFLKTSITNVRPTSTITLNQYHQTPQGSCPMLDASTRPTLFSFSSLSIVST